MKLLTGKPLALRMAAVALLASPAATLANSDIYVCQDAEGRKTYQNTGTGKGCTKLDVHPALTLPAPRQPAARPPSGESRAIAPANFPRVDSQTQRNRDGDRKRILEEELAAEESKLQALRQEYNNGEPERLGSERNYARYQERVARLQADLQRAENNIASLKRELALLSRQ
jgi:hypothetical protein